MRHYWLDRVIELVPGQRAVGLKAVALSEDEFEAHFPGNPILPGIYLVEGLAQTAGVLLYRTTDRLALMTAVERVRFLAYARPGDQIRLTVTIESLDADRAARVRGEARCGERSLATGLFTFRLVPHESLVAPEYWAAMQRAFAVWQGDYLEP